MVTNPPDAPRFRINSCLTIVGGVFIGDILTITAALHFNAPFHDRPYLNVPLAFVAGSLGGGLAGAVVNGIVNPKR